MNIYEWLESSDMSVTRFSVILGIERTYLYQIIKNPDIASRRLLWRIYRMTGEQIEMFDKIKEAKPKSKKKAQVRKHAKKK